jgi:hypothetical protein
MTLKEYISSIFDYRIKDGDGGWDEAVQMLAKTGLWSISGSPRKFEKIILELCKRIERLEHERGTDGTKTV